MSGLIEADADDADGWEAIEQSQPVFSEHDYLLEGARRLQSAISDHQAVDTDVGWSEVVVELPDASRGRRSRVAFRRISGPQRSSKTLPALDLSKSPEELLSTVSLAQVIRSADASALLLACVAQSALFNVTALDFLADADSEERFQTVPGLRLREYFEIVDTLNAFTILVHGSATGTGFVYRPSQLSTLVEEPVTHTRATAEPVQRPPTRSPAEVLENTLLGQIVLGRGSPALQRALRSSGGFNLSVQAFLEHDDAEAFFCSDRGMSMGIYLELDALVGEFTTRTLNRA